MDEPLPKKYLRTSYLDYVIKMTHNKTIIYDPDGVCIAVLLNANGMVYIRNLIQRHRRSCES